MEVLLIRRRDQAMWSLPKGRPSPTKLAHEMAAIEAFEEAGVRGLIGEQPIGSFLYRKSNNTPVEQRIVEVLTFPLQVTHQFDNWPEASFRVRQWAKPERAADWVAPGQLPDLIRSLERTDVRTAILED